MIKRFYSFVFKYKWMFIITLFFTVIYSLVSNLFPLYLRDLVNATQVRDFELAYKFFIFIIVVKFFEVVTHVIAQHFGDVVVIKAAADLRHAVFKHIHSLDFHYHTNKSSGRLISLFKRGEGAFITFFEELNIWTLKIILDFVFMTVILSQIYLSMMYISLAVFFANAVLMYFTVSYNISKRKIFNKVEDEVTAVTVDNMIAFDTVKYFAKEKFEQNKLRRILNTWVNRFIDYVISFRIIDIGNGGLINLGMIVIIGVALSDLINQKVSVGDFVLATTFATLFFPALKNLVFRFREIAKNYEDLHYYITVLDEEIRVVDNPSIKAQKEFEASVENNANQVKIDIKDVDFSYDGKRTIVNDINLTIKTGESVAFVGKSGAGKTTMTRLLMRFYDVSKGAILFNDVDIRRLPKKMIRELVGLVPQETVLFNSTLGYNIAYARPEATEQELIEAAKAANLHTFLKDLDLGFDTLVGERGIKLSGGQKQRLAIARVFIENSPIIIFDEATSSLDSESEQLIQQAFWKVAKNKTTIIIAHRLSTIQKVDRIVVFDQGRIVETGTHQELSNKSDGIYKYLWKLQSEGELIA